MQGSKQGKQVPDTIAGESDRQAFPSDVQLQLPLDAQVREVAKSKEQYGLIKLSYDDNLDCICDSEYCRIGYDP